MFMENPQPFLPNIIHEDPNLWFEDPMFLQAEEGEEDGEEEEDFDESDIHIVFSTGCNLFQVRGIILYHR